MIDKPTSPIIRQTNNLTQAMENQIESDMELRDSLNRDLRVRKQVEDLFYLINPYFNPEIGISKHIFLRSVQLDENVRSALLVWPQLKVLGQPKLYINAFKRLDTNEDNYVSIDELSHFIRCGQHVDKSGAKLRSFHAEKLEAVIVKLFGLVHVELNDTCSIKKLIDAFNTDTSVRSLLLGHRELWAFGNPKTVVSLFDGIVTTQKGVISAKELVMLCKKIMANEKVNQKNFIKGNAQTDGSDVVLTPEEIPMMDKTLKSRWIRITQQNAGLDQHNNDAEGEEEENENNEINDFLQHLTIASKEEAMQMKRTTQKYKLSIENRISAKLRDIPSIVKRALVPEAINEIKSFTKPPRYVKFVMEPVCILFGRRPTWKNSRLLLARTRLLQDLKDINVETLSESTMTKISKYIMHPEFDPETMFHTSYAAANLCFWVHAMYEFYNVSVSLRPWRRKLDIANQKLEHVEEFINSHLNSKAVNNAESKEKDYNEFSMHFVKQFDDILRGAHQRKVETQEQKQATDTELSTLSLSSVGASSDSGTNKFRLHPVNWVGSPSSFKSFTFSASANTFVINTQDVPRRAPPLPLKYQRSTRKKGIRRVRSQTAGRTRRQNNVRSKFDLPDVRQRRRPKTAPTGEVLGRPAWIGSPSSFRELTFSSSANKIIVNKQAIPTETPPVPGFTRSFVMDSSVSGLDAPQSQMTVSSTRSNRSLIKSLSKTQSRLSKVLGLVPKPVEHDSPWQGSPSSQLPFTFSRTANKHFKNKQLWPVYDASKVQGCSFTHTKKFKAFYTKQLQRQKLDKTMRIKLRQKEYLKKQKGQLVTNKSLGKLDDFSLSTSLGPDGVKNLTSFIQKLFNAWQSNKERLNMLPESFRGFDIDNEGGLPIEDIKSAFLSSGISLSKDELNLLSKVANSRSNVQRSKKSSQLIQYQPLLDIVFSYVDSSKSNKGGIVSI
eukprot:g5411.t1